MKILMILTSHDQLGNTDKKTGFWLEEFAAPYYVFHDAGADITLASPKGGHPPLDPKSDEADYQTKATERFRKDSVAQKMLANTLKLSNLSADEFAAVLYVGGHGPLWDLVNDAASIALIEAMYAHNKSVASVCHAPAVLLHAKDSQGHTLTKGKRVTAFSNSEEKAVQLDTVVPFLLEDALKANGAIYSKGNDWEPYVSIDGHLITGQNPASSEQVAKKLLNFLQGVEA